ncbi:MAG: tripartite tricarboxylate transporter substrate binding protein [Thermodesulfobacteriota bacterium]
MERKCHSGILFFLCFSLTLFIAEGNVFSAKFPEKPVKFIVAFAPGAGIDLEARGLVPYLQKYLGVSTTIENISGADGKIGLTKAWRANPDGYTLAIHTTTMTLMGEILLNPEYRVADFSHIYSWSLSNTVLVVNSEKWKTFDELVQDARKRPVSVGMAGRGSSTHLNSIILWHGLGIKVNWVPYDGAGNALAALAGGHIDVVAAATTSALTLVKAGKIRPLLVLANGKDIVYPDVPLAKDLGHKHTFVPMIRGADGPPKMEAPVVKVLEEAFAKAVKDPGYIQWANNRMMEIIPASSSEYGKMIEVQQKEIEKFRDLLKAGN